MQEEINAIEDKIGPAVTNRAGQFVTAKELGKNPDIENMPRELRENYANIFCRKAEVEDIEAQKAPNKDARDSHKRRAESFRTLRNLFKTE